MPRDGWHITRDGASLTLSRHAQPRFDLAVETVLHPSHLARARIAHQIRQDMWRRLQRVRGFAPVVKVTRHEDHLAVVAGGTVAGTVTPSMRAALADVLEAPDLRARWIRCARPKRSTRPERTSS